MLFEIGRLWLDGHPQLGKYPILLLAYNTKSLHYFSLEKANELNGIAYVD
jgi:hypothetical protein